MQASKDFLMLSYLESAKFASNHIKIIFIYNSAIFQPYMNIALILSPLE